MKTVTRQAIVLPSICDGLAEKAVGPEDEMAKRALRADEAEPLLRPERQDSPAAMARAAANQEASRIAKKKKSMVAQEEFPMIFGELDSAMHRAAMDLAHEPDTKTTALVNRLSLMLLKQSNVIKDDLPFNPFNEVLCPFDVESDAGLVKIEDIRRVGPFELVDSSSGKTPPIKGAVNLRSRILSIFLSHFYPKGHHQNFVVLVKDVVEADLATVRSVIAFCFHVFYHSPILRNGQPFALSEEQRTAIIESVSKFRVPEKTIIPLRTPPPLISQAIPSDMGSAILHQGEEDVFDYEGEEDSEIDAKIMDMPHHLGSY